MKTESTLQSSKEIIQTMDNCTKCGICHAYCPVAIVSNKFPGPKYTGPQTQRFRVLETLNELSPDLCNGCGICMSVCPNDVAITDIITLAKSNLRNKSKSIPLIQKILNRPDLVGKLGNLFPVLSNLILHNNITRFFADLLFKLDSTAPLPSFKGKAFKQFANKIKNTNYEKNIIYFSGCAVDNYDPDVGIDAIKLMNTLGYNVIVNSELCCSLPMLSSGEWDASIPRSKKLMNSLDKNLRESNVIISTSTSCSLTIKKKYAAYLDFTDPKSIKVSNSINDICEYILENHKEDLRKKMKPLKKRIFYHGPCQLRSHGMGQPAVELLRLIPELEIALSEADCCGIGGTFGYVKDKSNISKSISKSLVDQVKFEKPDIVICDSETCRWNIEKTTGIKTIHPVQLFAQLL